MSHHQIVGRHDSPNPTRAARSMGELPLNVSWFCALTFRQSILFILPAYTPPSVTPGFVRPPWEIEGYMADT
jgi:hypothetical protein